MDTISIIGIILGSNVIIEIIKQFFVRNQRNAGTVKLKNEAGQIVIEGELKISEFYKREWQELLARYEELEKKMEAKQKEADAMRLQVNEIQKQYTDIQRQFTLMKNIK